MKRKEPEPDEIIENRLQLLPAETASRVLEFCRYDGTTTALNYAYVMGLLDHDRYGALQQDELLRAMPAYLDMAGAAASPALLRELKEVGGERERVRAVYVPPAELPALLRDLRAVHLMRCCRFCVADASMTCRHDKSIEAKLLARGLPRRLGAYSCRSGGVDGGQPFHYACFSRRLSRLRLADGTSAWIIPSESEAGPEQVRRGLGADQWTASSHPLPFVRADAYAQKRERERRVDEFFAVHLDSIHRSRATELEHRLQADPWLGRLTNVQGTVDDALCTLLDPFFDYVQAGRRVPTMPLGDLAELVAAGRELRIIQQLSKQFQVYCKRSTDANYMLAMRAAYSLGEPSRATAERLYEALNDVVRRLASEELIGPMMDDILALALNSVGKK